MTRIETRLGSIQGVQNPGSLSFLSIPYAQPPVGNLRWHPPQSPEPWNAVLDATRHPNRAFQAPFPDDLLPPGGIPGDLSEDMLYLNVHTPAADDKARPVMVYIHGGGYTLGSANDFDPSPFAGRNDVVVVAINYRLGVCGFLDLSRFGAEFEGSSSLGFQDQIMALRWVNEHIADYGGDPSNITILGCSAGGGSVITLLSAPSARGLFARGIAMSPLEVSPAPLDIITPCAAAMNMSEVAFFEHLRSLAAEDLFKLQTDFGIGTSACVDGKVIVQPTVEGIRNGVNPVPLLTGCTLREGPMLTDGVIKAFGNDEAVLRALEGGMSGINGGGDAERYTRYLDGLCAEATPEERLDQVWFDCFRSSTLRTAQALSDAGYPSWVYTFAVPTEHRFGPTHGSDVTFAFNSLDPELDGEMYVYHRNNAENREIARCWSESFVTFMKNGDPNWSGMPDWPLYDRKDRACLVLGASPAIEQNPDGLEALAAYGLV